MSKPTLQAIAIKKSLELSEQEATKVLIFMAGMEAGRELQFTNGKKNEADQPRKPPKQPYEDRKRRKEMREYGSGQDNRCYL